GGQLPADRPAARRQPERRHRLGREEEGRQERRADPGGRLAQELHAPDRAADPGGAGAGGERARLLPPGDRRPAGHRRAVGGDAGRGDDLGKGGPGAAARHGDVLRGLDGGAAAVDGVRPVDTGAATAAAADGPAGGADGAAGGGVQGALAAREGVRAGGDGMERLPQAEVEYPTGDGQPMAETGIHVMLMLWLIAALRRWYA